ncbi:MAG: type II secretion system protein M [Thiotrichaceae bacterium]
MLIGGTLLTIGLLIYFMLWQPLLEAHHNLLSRVAAQQATLVWMQSAAQQIQQLRSKTPDNSKNAKQPIQATIENSLQTGKLAKLTKHLDSKNDHEVQLDFEQINFTDLVSWLATLQNQYAIQIQRINITRLSAADSVKVQITFNQ